MVWASRTGDPVAVSEAMRSWARRAVDQLDIGLELRGLEHLTPGERYVVVPLHEGFLDVVALLHLPLQLRFAARRELAEWRIVGRVLQETDQIVIDTDRPRSGLRQLLRQGQAADRRGESVVVFPQASVLGIEVAFQGGAVALARHLGRRILPVVLTGSHTVWDYPFHPLVRFGERITLEVLPPVAAEDFPGVEEKMKAKALGPDRAPARRFDPARDGFWDGYPFEIDPSFEQVAATLRAHRDR